MPDVFYNQTTGRPRHMLLYMNGVEIPCETASMSFGIWRFPEYTFDVPADALLHRIGADDKIQSALFYLDVHAYEKPTYCLLGEGEIVSWAYNRSGSSRNIQLYAIDALSTLTQLFLYYINDVNSALGNTINAREAGAAGNVVAMSALPLGFFYEALQAGGGKTINRPVDLLLNIMGSLSGYDSATKTPVYSRKKSLLELVTRAQQLVSGAKAPTGDVIAASAKRVIGRGVPGSLSTDTGPRSFSNAGLVVHAARDNNLNLLAAVASATPQGLYTYCQANNTFTTSDLGPTIPGALMFESDTGDATNITHVGIITQSGKVVEVVSQDRTVLGSGGFERVYASVQRHESRGDAGLVHLDEFPSGKPAGLAVGLIQHNQKVGTLYDIMQAMRTKNSVKFDAIMGPTDLGLFTGPKKEFQNYAFYANQPYWFPRFRALFSDPEMLSVQNAFDKTNYFKPMLALAVQYGVAVEKYVAVLFDAGVQIGRSTAVNLMALASQQVGQADKKALMERFTYYADRSGFSKDQLREGSNWGRRARIMADASLSDKVTVSFAGTPTKIKSGIVETDVNQPYRKIIAYGLIPGADYTGLLPKGTTINTVKVSSGDNGARLRNLYNQKNERILTILRQTYGQRATYTKEQQIAAENIFRKNFPDHQKQVASASRAAQTLQTKNRALQRAKAAIHFFMRWLSLTKTREKIIACPVFDGNDPGKDYIFPVLSAMNTENIARALVNYAQYTSGNSGSMWDFVRQVFEIMLYELVNVPAPGSYILDDRNNIVGRNDGKIAGTASIGTYLPKPHAYFSLPPSCNVIFPSMYEQFSYRENYATQPTRTYMGDPTQAAILGTNRNNSALSYTQNTKSAYPPEVDAALFDPKHIGRNNKDVVVFPVEYYKGPVTNRKQTPTWMYFLYRELQKNTKSQQRLATKPKDAPNVGVKVSGRDVTYTRGSQQFTLPYTNDSKSDARTLSFSQQGYYRGKPIRFNAIRVGDHILHVRAGEDFVRLQQEASRAGVTLTINSAYRTAAEQTALAGTSSDEQPGYSKHQSGAKITLSLSPSNKQKSIDFLRTNAGRFGFAVAADGSITSRTALAEITTQYNTSSQRATSTNKKNPRYVSAILPQIVFDIVHTKGAKLFTAQQQPQHQIYRQYAEYEHFREVYASRTAAGSGVFNPYLWPGFSSYVFDEDPTNFHVAGYLTSGVHTISNAGQSSTQWNTVHNRTFHEMFELANITRTGLCVGPKEPIPDVSNTLQQIREARNFYAQLIYGQADFRGKDPLGDYQKLLGWANNDGPPDRIVADPTQSDYNIGSEFNREIQTLPSASKYFLDTNAALEYCARPVCTLEQYIDFYGGVRYTTLHPGDKILNNNGDSPTFYYQIRDFAYGAGITADPTEPGISQADEYTRLKAMPKTLRDWQTSLLLYRQKIYANLTSL